MKFLIYSDGSIVQDLLCLQHNLFLRLVGFVVITTYWVFMDICIIDKNFFFRALFKLKNIEKGFGTL